MILDENMYERCIFSNFCNPVLFLTEIFYKITHILGLTLIQRTSNTFYEKNFNLSIFNSNPSKVLFLSLYTCYVKHNGAIIHTPFSKRKISDDNIGELLTTLGITHFTPKATNMNFLNCLSIV